MDLIFHDGMKVLNKEKEHRETGIKLLEQYGCIHVNKYQRQVLGLMFNQNKKEFNIYGDDYKVEFTPQNVRRRCSMTLYDYDGNQKLESEISIDFSKDELEQFISLLQTIRRKMD